MTIAACILLGACSGGRKNAPFIKSVYVTTPVKQETEITKNYSGIIEEAHCINLGFKTAGQLSRLWVKEGDYVRQGQLLAELDTVDYQLAVEALQIQYDQLKDEMGRTAQLFRERSISANDYEKAIAGLEQLAIQLEANKNKLTYTKLYAPTNGYVNKINFSPAEMVDAGTGVFELLDVSQLEVSLDIPASLYMQRDRFTGFECQTTCEDIYSMRLLSLTPKADSYQLYRMRLGFKEKTGNHLTAGMNAEITIHLSATDTLRTGHALPLSAIFLDHGDTYVWIVSADSTATKRHVTLHRTTSKAQAIVSGVSGNDQVIRAGIRNLQEGEKIHVIASPSETNVGGLL